MGRIYFLMGKSASGQDTVYKLLMEEVKSGLKKFVIYTTRPIRDGEKDGVEYHFVTDEDLCRLEAEGKVIEKRVYKTVAGPWTYFTADDGQIDLKSGNYLTIGTLESYEKLKAYFGEESVFPIYIYLDDGERLKRAVERERRQENPNYRELCRRFLADEEDFKEENLLRYGIKKRYENTDLETCLKQIMSDIETEKTT